MCVHLHVVRHAYIHMSVQICVCVPAHTFHMHCFVQYSHTRCTYSLFLTLCVCVCVVIFSRLRGGGSVGQCEAEPEGVHQEDSVPGQPAAQSA